MGSLSDFFQVETKIYYYSTNCLNFHIIFNFYLFLSGLKKNGHTVTWKYLAQ